MINPFQKITCPYCYNTFKKSESMWRCNSYSCKNEKKEVDEKYCEYHNITNPESNKQPHIIQKSKVKKGYVQCDLCGDSSNKKICPVCHSMLPSTDENIIISIIGGPGSGKSYYVGSLLKQLYASGTSVNCALRFTTPDDSKMYYDRYNKYFEKKQVLQKTKPPANGVNIVGANLPVLCDIYDYKKVKRTFTFFDAAGENFEDESTMRYLSPYISHSSAIILLLDPTKIEYVKNVLMQEKHDLFSDLNQVRENDTSFDIILKNIVDVIRNQNKSNGIIDIPIAVTFSKWDMVENSEALRPEGCNILNPSPHFSQGFSETDCENVSSEVEGLLGSWGYSNFVELVKKDFKTYKFFGCSAIGSAIDKNGNAPNIVSKRVEDPFLWLMHQKKFIK